MKVLEVIESKRWRNTKTNATASLYGACPWTSDADKQAWVLEVVGWTWRNADGTIGLGRVPAKTREEALDVMARINSKSTN